MKILLVAATTPEIAPFLAAHGIDPVSTGQGFTAAGIRSGNAVIDLLITGAGINNATYHIGNTLAMEQFDLCIQAGICGAFGDTFEKGKVLHIVKERFAQCGAEDGTLFHDVFELGLMDANTFPYEQGWLINKQTFPYPSLHALETATGITVETVHGNETGIRRITEKYHPDTESMEGASFFYCCLMQQVPFMQIRSVSNKVEKRNKDNWNINLAVENLNNFLQKLLSDCTA